MNLKSALERRRAEIILRMALAAHSPHNEQELELAGRIYASCCTKQLQIQTVLFQTVAKIIILECPLN